MTLIKILIWLTGGTVFFFLTILLSSFFRYFRPRKNIPYKNPSNYNLAFEQISFAARDGRQLSAWFILAEEPTDKTIIFLHGLNNNKLNSFILGGFLQEKYNLFIFDFRAHGDSSGTFTSLGALFETEDLLGAIDYLKEKKPEQSRQLGIFSYSMGAAVALMTLPRLKEIRAVVADTSFASLEKMAWYLFRSWGWLGRAIVQLSRWLGKLIFRVDIRQVAPARAVRKTSVPILLIHGEKDRRIGVEQAYLIKKNCPDYCTLWVVPEAGHCQSRFVSSKEYRKKVAEFFAQHL